VTAVGTRRSSVRTWVVVAVAVAVVGVAGALMTDSVGPYALDNAGPDGYAGLVAMLNGAGAEVDEMTFDDAVRSGADSVLVVNGFSVGPSQMRQLRTLAGAGTRVVVAGVPGTFDTGSSEVGFVEITAQPGNCTLPALAGVEGLGPIDTAELVALEVRAGQPACFTTNDGAHVALDGPEGSDGPVLISGPQFFANDVMRAKDQPAFQVTAPLPDNAVVAVALLAPVRGQQVVIVRSGTRGAPTGASDRSLLDEMSFGAKLGLLQLLVAMVVFAVVSGRRFGRPVTERLPVAIAGSELVVARGALMARRRDPARAASVVRRRAVANLGEQLGAGRAVTVPELALIVAGRTGRPADEVAAVLGHRPVTTGEQLVALVEQIDTLRGELQT